MLTDILFPTAQLVDLERKFQSLQQVGPITTTCLTSFTENTLEVWMELAFLS